MRLGNLGLCEFVMYFDSSFEARAIFDAFCIDLVKLVDVKWYENSYLRVFVNHIHLLVVLVGLSDHFNYQMDMLSRSDLCVSC